MKEWRGGGFLKFLKRCSKDFPKLEQLVGSFCVEFALVYYVCVKSVKLNLYLIHCLW